MEPTIRTSTEGIPVGRDVEHMVFSREDRRRFRDKMRRCLDALAEMLRESQFDFERPMTGMEIELNLVDDDGGYCGFKCRDPDGYIVEAAWEPED